MACGGAFSAVMSVAGAGLLPGASAIPSLGSALGPASSLTSSITSFTSLPITSQFSSVVTNATGELTSGTLQSLRTLGSSTFPALTNAIPSSFTSSLSPIAAGGVFDGGFTGLMGTTASQIMGGGDISKFAQIYNSTQGYLAQANQLVNSSLNLGSISSTFGPVTGGMDNLITGGFNQVSQAFGALGSDMSKLGNLIDTNNLTNLGDPSALVRQLASVGGLVPGVETALRSAGIGSNDVANLVSGGFVNIGDTSNKLLYEGMTKITGAELAQVKSVLGVTTPGINSMADLLNPAKILPTSYQTLTMPTPDGLRGIYSSPSSVNTKLEKFLIDPNAPAYTGDDPVVQARLGLSPAGAIT